MADRFDLDAIDADDALLDLLAAGGESARTAGEHDPAVQLLAELRLAVEVEDELPVETIDDPESFLARCAALNPVTDPFARKMAARSLALGVAAVAALSVSGVAAAVTGDPLSPYEKVIEKMVDAVNPQTSFPKDELDGMPVVDKSKIVKVAKDYQEKQEQKKVDAERKAADEPIDIVDEPPAALAKPEPLPVPPKPAATEQPPVVRPTTQPTNPPETTDGTAEQKDQTPSEEQPTTTPTEEPATTPTEPPPTTTPNQPATTPTTEPATPTPTTSNGEAGGETSTPPGNGDEDKNPNPNGQAGDPSSSPAPQAGDASSDPQSGDSENGSDSGETGDDQAAEETPPAADKVPDEVSDAVADVLPELPASVEQRVGEGLKSLARHSNGKVSTGSVKAKYPAGRHSSGKYAEGRHAAIERVHGSTDAANVLKILKVVNTATK